MPMPMNLSRSLLTILIPGLVATAPWLLVLVQHTSATLGFDTNPTIANALVFALVAVVGSMCEGLGTYREAKWDAKLESKYSVQEHWHRYLAYRGEREPIAFRYLSRLVTTLYFELSMFFAVPFFILGACALAALRFPQHQSLFVISAIGLTPLSMWFFDYKARQTHEGMCKVRMHLNLPELSHVS